MALLLARSLLAPKPAAAQAGPLTAGAILGAAVVVEVLVADLIEDAAGEAKDVLQQVDAMLDELIRHINETYGAMLDVTVDKLDQTTRTLLARLSSLMQQLQADLQVGISRLNETILADLRFITAEVRKVIAQARELVAVAVLGATLVVDKAAFNALLIVALVLLAVGLLLFVWLLFTRPLPAAGPARSLLLTGMAVFVLICVFLLLPQGRVYALTWAGYGGRLEALTHPAIFDVSPDTVVAGRTQEVWLTGSTLSPNGRLPSVEIAGIDVPVSGGDEAIAASVAGLDFAGRTGNQTIRLTTAEDPPKVATAAVVISERRPLPRVTAWTLRPVGRGWEQGGHNSRSGIGCRAPERRPFDTRACSEEEVIRVLPGYYLDMDRMAELGRKPGGDVFSNPGDASRGFTETITSFARRHGDPRDPTRRVDYDPPGPNPVAIKVKVSARNDAGQDPDGKRAAFYATYTVYGRRANPNATAREWTFQGSCAVSGTVDCGSYPYAGELDRLTENLRYVASVTFKDASDATVFGTGTLIPNDSESFVSAALRYEDTDGRLRDAAIQFRVVGQSVRVSGPDLGLPPAPLVAPRLPEILRRHGRPVARPPG
jgi:hypothetical protein